MKKSDFYFDLPEELIAQTPLLQRDSSRMMVLNRVDQADPKETRRWAAYFREKGYAVMEANAKSGSGTAQFSAAVRELLRAKTPRTARVETAPSRGLFLSTVRVVQESKSLVPVV